MFVGVIELSDLFASFVENMQSFWVVLNTPVIDLLVNNAYGEWWLIAKLIELLNNNGFLAEWFNYSLITVLLGSAFGIYALLTFTKWLFNIFPGL